MLDLDHFPRTIQLPTSLVWHSELVQRQLKDVLSNIGDNKFLTIPSMWSRPSTRVSNSFVRVTVMKSAVCLWLSSESITCVL